MKSFFRGLIALSALPVASFVFAGAMGLDYVGKRISADSSADIALAASGTVASIALQLNASGSTMTVAGHTNVRIYNDDANEAILYVGFTSDVTNLTGWPVRVNTSQEFPISSEIPIFVISTTTTGIDFRVVSYK